MNKKIIATPLVDEHLANLEGMQAAETDAFFYTRLKARMEKDAVLQNRVFPFRPSWLIACLILLLLINGVILSQQFRSAPTSATNLSSLQHFAQAFDQTLSASY
jgi:hypothetical protein